MAIEIEGRRIELGHTISLEDLLQACQDACAACEEKSLLLQPVVVVYSKAVRVRVYKKKRFPLWDRFFGGEEGCIEFFIMGETLDLRFCFFESFSDVPLRYLKYDSLEPILESIVARLNNGNNGNGHH